MKVLTKIQTKKSKYKIILTLKYNYFKHQIKIDF